MKSPFTIYRAMFFVGSHRQYSLEWEADGTKQHVATHQIKDIINLSMVEYCSRFCLCKLLLTLEDHEIQKWMGGKSERYYHFVCVERHRALSRHDRRSILTIPGAYSE